MKIGLGTAAIGRPHYINVREDENTYSSLEMFKKQGLLTLDTAFNLGVRYFDTAPGYGIAEELLIEWLEQRNPADVEVATKWGYTYVANFQKNVSTHEIKEHSLPKLNEQWTQSQHLFPHLTTYQIHSATLESGVLENQEVLERLAELKKEYGIRIGLTSTSATQNDVLEKSLDIHFEGEMLFDVFQVTYNILDQSLRNICTQLSAANKRVVVKEALANGRLLRNANYPHYGEVYSTLERLALTYNVGVDAVALRFCMDSIHPFVVLSGAISEKQLTENVSAMDFRLSNEDLESLYLLAVETEDYWNERKNLSSN